MRDALQQELVTGVCQKKPGQGDRKDDKEAVHWFRNSAEQQFAEAEYYLGLMYAKTSKTTNQHHKSTTEKGLQSNPDAAAIQEDDWEFIKQAQKYSGYGGLSSPKKGIRLLRNVKQIKKKDWTDEKKADFIYNWMKKTLDDPMFKEVPKSKEQTPKRPTETSNVRGIRYTHSDIDVLGF